MIRVSRPEILRCAQDDIGELPVLVVKAHDRQDAMMNVDKERGKTQACHPERSEGSALPDDSRVETGDPERSEG
jgi:hypothetical protein